MVKKKKTNPLLVIALIVVAILILKGSFNAQSFQSVYAAEAITSEGGGSGKGEIFPKPMSFFENLRMMFWGEEVDAWCCDNECLHQCSGDQNWCQDYCDELMEEDCPNGCCDPISQCGSNWACDNCGWIADCNYKRCCPPDLPNYCPRNNRCYTDEQISMCDAPTSTEVDVYIKVNDNYQMFIYYKNPCKTFSSWWQVCDARASYDMTLIPLGYEHVFDLGKYNTAFAKVLYDSDQKIYYEKNPADIPILCGDIVCPSISYIEDDTVRITYMKGLKEVEGTFALMTIFTADCACRELRETCPGGGYWQDGVCVLSRTQQLIVGEMFTLDLGESREFNTAIIDLDKLVGVADYSVDISYVSEAGIGGEEYLWEFE